MHSNILASITMVLAIMFVKMVKADDSIEWFAISYADGDQGFQFLDSDNSNVVTNKKPNKDSVDSGNDKGMRWKFLSGLGVNGYIATQAHESHIVGYDASDNEFHADFKSSNDDSAVVAQFLNGSERVTLCYNDNCIGPGGKKTTEKFVWDIDQLQEA